MQLLFAIHLYNQILLTSAIKELIRMNEPSKLRQRNLPPGQSILKRNLGLPAMEQMIFFCYNSLLVTVRMNFIHCLRLFACKQQNKLVGLKHTPTIGLRLNWTFGLVQVKQQTTFCQGKYHQQATSIFLPLKAVKKHNTHLGLTMKI